MSQVTQGKKLLLTEKAADAKALSPKVVSADMPKAQPDEAVVEVKAAAVNPSEARLVGVRVPLMLGLGWGLAAVLGAIAGMLTAPSVFLDPNMMQSVLIYAFAAAVLGGIDSPAGAVVGGLILGVGLNLIGAYVDFIGSDLRLPAALLVILVVLLVRPAGLFGKPEVKKV